MDDSGHAYPHELALLTRARWNTAVASNEARDAAPNMLPDHAVLERLLSVCYQASLLREEGRPVTFRLALGDPEAFAARAGPPEGLHRLVFMQARPLDEHELRRLAPAAPFHRSLVAARFDPASGLQIWGLVHSGPRWLQSVRGGRDIEQAIPEVLMVAVTGPGRVLVSRGTTTIAELTGGSLAGLAMDVFRAPWMPELFSGIHEKFRSANAAFQDEPRALESDVDPVFGRLLAEHAMRRIVATIRGAHHGGTLIVVPDHVADELRVDTRYIRLKYGFRDEEPRRRVVTLIVRIIHELASLQSASPNRFPSGWSEYEASRSPRLAALDEALFEVAHLVAALADVDGAVVMTDCLELLGFGGEISGALPDVSTVAHALDLEGTRRQWLGTDRVGTRHRSAYRLCHQMHEAVAVVISQDGGVRFIRWHDDSVTYWDQVATGPWEV